MRKYLALLLLLGIASCSAIQFKYCQTSSYLNISKIDVSVPTPHANDNVTIITTGSIGKTSDILTYGYVIVTISLGRVKLKDYSYFICGNVQPPCPLKQNMNPVVLTLSQNVPAYVLPGTYTFTVQAYDQDDKEKACVFFNLKVL